MKLTLKPKRDPRTVEVRQVEIKNLCCSTFLKACEQNALRLFPQPGGDVMVYVAKPVMDHARQEPHHNIQFCPWCGEKIK